MINMNLFDKITSILNTQQQVKTDKNETISHIENVVYTETKNCVEPVYIEFNEDYISIYLSMRLTSGIPLTELLSICEKLGIPIENVTIDYKAWNNPDVSQNLDSAYGTDMVLKLWNKKYEHDEYMY